MHDAPQPPPPTADGELPATQQPPATGAPFADTADPTLAYPAATPTGPRYGRFTVRRFHARGGVGEVYVAEDEELRRSVAFKQLRPQFAADAAIRRRFVLEAELTGKLEHPGIVPIYGLVQMPDGQPFYAMRFIEGVALHEAIKQWHERARQTGRTAEVHLAFRGLLQTLVTVCKTMAYAHSRGVIHRDLKPHNIMLGQFGETLVVDWGMAKELSIADCRLPNGEQGDADATALGQAKGTPAYMSPEQAHGEWDAVGPASDVFALGAILYALLTGQAPYHGQDAYETLEKAQAAVFPLPRQVAPAAPRALEAICLKAMAQQPQERYASAIDLADDLEHWLADEPVAAYREPWPLRARRWTRRHRTSVAVAVAVLAVSAILLGLLTGVVAAKNTELRAAYDQVLAARDRARKTIEDVSSEGALDALARQKALTPDQQQFLRKMVEYYADFARETAGSEADRRGQAVAHFRMGRMLSALGRLTESETAYRQAIAAFEQLAADYPTMPEYRRRLADSRNNLYILLEDLGRHEAAAVELRAALALQEQLAATYPAVPAHRSELARSHNNLANVAMRQEQTAEAEKQFRRALAIQQQLVDQFPDAEYRLELARTHSNLAVLLTQLNRRGEAETSFRRALELQRDLVAKTPAEPDYRRELAAAHNNLGNLLLQLDRRDEAIAEMRHALSLYERLADEFPTVPLYRRELGGAQLNLGVLFRDAGRHEEAVAAFRKVVALREALAAETPNVPDVRQELAEAYHALNLALLDLGQRDEAEAMLRRGVAVWQRLAADFPRNARYAVALGTTCWHFGNQLQAAGQLDKSLELYAEAIAVLGKAASPDDPKLAADAAAAEARRTLANTHAARAKVFSQMGRGRDAVADWDLAVTLAADKNRWAYRVLRAVPLARAGEHARAVAEASELAVTAKADANVLYELARACALAASTVKNDAELQNRYGARAVELLRQAIAKGFEDVALLKKDADLEALRSRADYQKLEQELKP